VIGASRHGDVGCFFCITGFNHVVRAFSDRKVAPPVQSQQIPAGSKPLAGGLGANGDDTTGRQRVIESPTLEGSKHERCEPFGFDCPASARMNRACRCDQRPANC
jgi:hypothetical protein